MNEKRIELPYGHSTQSFSIPEKNLAMVLLPEEFPGIKDEQAEIRRALNRPIGTPRLRDMLQGHEKVAILVSDITRSSPSHKLLPPLLEELGQAGIADEHVLIVFGLGMHRSHTADEMKYLVGETVFHHYKCMDHDRNNCVYVADTPDGIPVEIFRPVAEADFIIGTGNLEIHYSAGYSGGHKALLPGVASEATILANHKTMFDPGVAPGRVEGNPFRLGLEAVGWAAGLKFILNVTLNSQKEIVGVVAGDPVLAHRAGIKAVDRMYKRSIPKLADIGIVSPGGFPKDINLYQSQKGLDHASYGVKPKGPIIWVAQASQGLGENLFEDWMKKARTPQEPMTWIRQEYKLGAHKAAAICRVLLEHPVYLVSDLDEDLVKQIFFKPCKTVQEALEAALASEGPDAQVMVVPYGNSTLPVVEN